MLFITSIRRGIKYANLWPKEKILNNVFKEGLIIDALNFNNKSAPPILAIYLIVSFIFYRFYNYEFTMQNITTLFIILLFTFIASPIGYAYLGNKSSKKLLSKQQIWYEHMCTELGYTPNKSADYMELATVLSKICKDEKLKKKILSEL